MRAIRRSDPAEEEEDDEEEPASTLRRGQRQSSSSCDFLTSLLREPYESENEVDASFEDDLGDGNPGPRASVVAHEETTSICES